MPRKSRMDSVLDELRELKQIDPHLEYVGRRTDGGRKRVQLNVTPDLAEKLLPAIRQDAGRRKAS